MELKSCWDALSTNTVKAANLLGLHSFIKIFTDPTWSQPADCSKQQIGWNLGWPTGVTVFLGQSWWTVSWVSPLLLCHRRPAIPVQLLTAVLRNATCGHRGPAGLETWSLPYKSSKQLETWGRGERDTQTPQSLDILVELAVKSTKTNPWTLHKKKIKASTMNV